jgi:hypothetical protein
MLIKPLVGAEWLSWSPRFRSYAQENIMCQGTTFAFTAHDEWQSISFCPLAFEFSKTLTKRVEEWRPNNYGRNQYSVGAFDTSNILTRAYTHSE